MPRKDALKKLNRRFMYAAKEDMKVVGGREEDAENTVRQR